MKIFLLVTLLLMAIPQGQSGVAPAISSEGLPVTVLSIKWFKDHQTIEQTSANGPAAAMIPQNKLFERNRRANTSPGERDPNLDTLDGRSAAMEKAVQDSRAAKPVDGFAYRVKIHNATAKPIEIIFWEYQFKESAAAAPLLRRVAGPAAATRAGPSRAHHRDDVLGVVCVAHALDRADGTLTSD